MQQDKPVIVTDKTLHVPTTCKPNTLLAYQEVKEHKRVILRSGSFHFRRNINIRQINNSWITVFKHCKCLNNCRVTKETTRTTGRHITPAMTKENLITDIWPIWYKTVRRCHKGQYWSWQDSKINFAVYTSRLNTKRLFTGVLSF